MGVPPRAGWAPSDQLETGKQACYQALLDFLDLLVFGALGRRSGMVAMPSSYQLDLRSLATTSTV